MANDPHITDHDPILAAARADASREGARMVKLNMIELWQMVHRRSGLASAEREQLTMSLRDH